MTFVSVAARFSRKFPEQEHYEINHRFRPASRHAQNTAFHAAFRAQDFYGQSIEIDQIRLYMGQQKG